jgi:hypothetical protein
VQKINGRKLDGGRKAARAKPDQRSRIKRINLRA